MIGRRLLLKGALAMTGDGLRAPMNAPGGGQPIPGIQPGDEPVTIANRVYVVGPGGGIFVYNPTQARNNLVETAGITGATHDKFGNTILPGDTLYMNQGGTYYALQIAGGAGAVPLVHWWVSPTDQTGTYTTLFIVGLVVSAGLNGIDLGSAAAFANPPQCFSAPLYAQDPTTPASGRDAWHTMSGFVNGWVATANTPRYRLGNNNNVILDGAMDASAATAATFFTIPAAYRPISPTKLVAAGANGGVIAGQSPFVQIANTGSVAALGLTLPTVGAHVTISGSYPLD